MSHIECVKNNGVPYLRLAESRYDKNKKWIGYNKLDKKNKDMIK